MMAAVTFYQEGVGVWSVAESLVLSGAYVPPPSAVEISAAPGPNQVFDGANWSAGPDPIIEERASAVLDKEVFCKKLYTFGVLPADEVIVSAENGWPQTFNSFVMGLSEAEQVDARVTWARRDMIHYGHPLLQALALSWATQQADVQAGTLTAEEKRTEILDQIYGIGG